eukprot:TRINITY_DN61989_c0_g1_i2.p2 TRINITY_DN61989_c0_g1~~TRINITY_DN61989_c0_g1_i2.p2  ORF type:complete len:110 (-),score=13.89 TRINITY_DN61989_c0_g1_i2:1111-1440(-)
MVALDHLPAAKGEISGVTGSLLCEGIFATHCDVSCLLSPTYGSFSEANSAVNMLRTLDAFFVDLKINTDSLQAKTEKMEKTIKNLLDQLTSQLPGHTGQSKAPPPMMYM